MVRNVFRLDDRQIGSLMVPRGDIVYLDVEEPLDDNLRRIAGGALALPGLPRRPRRGLGVISCEQLFKQARPAPRLARRLEPAVYVPETLTGMELLEQFRASGAKMVLVIDEYGEIQGLVTLQDVLEAVTGEFRPARGRRLGGAARGRLVAARRADPDRRTQRPARTARSAGRGQGPVPDAIGPVMWLLGRVPQTGDLADWHAGASRSWTWTASASTRSSPRGSACRGVRRPRHRAERRAVRATAAGVAASGC